MVVTLGVSPSTVFLKYKYPVGLSVLQHIALVEITWLLICYEPGTLCCLIAVWGLLYFCEQLGIDKVYELTHCAVAIQGHWVLEHNVFLCALLVSKLSPVADRVGTIMLVACQHSQSYVKHAKCHWVKLIGQVQL